MVVWPVVVGCEATVVIDDAENVWFVILVVVTFPVNLGM